MTYVMLVFLDILHYGIMISSGLIQHWLLVVVVITIIVLSSYWYLPLTVIVTIG